jgi:hypothetical protein
MGDTRQTLPVDYKLTNLYRNPSMSTFGARGEGGDHDHEHGQLEEMGPCVHAGIPLDIAIS